MAGALCSDAFFVRRCCLTPVFLRRMPHSDSDAFVASALLQQWVRAGARFGVVAMIVLGPLAVRERKSRQVLARYPDRCADIAQLLADASDIGEACSRGSSSLVRWEDMEAPTAAIAHGSWRWVCRVHGLRTVIQVTVPSADLSFEAFVFSGIALCRGDVGALTLSVLEGWPAIKHALVRGRSPLSNREHECLALAYDGLCAREIGLRLGCTERTANYHLANVKLKLGVDTTIGAIQRALRAGLI